jgi:hypothetical protein
VIKRRYIESKIVYSVIPKKQSIKKIDAVEQNIIEVVNNLPDDLDDVNNLPF